jgi:hypothetical protein
MDNRKICTRCQGRMFLEYDYTDQGYDYTCISCGRVEHLITAKSSPEKSPAVKTAGRDSKIRSVVRV